MAVHFKTEQPTYGDGVHFVQFIICDRGDIIENEAEREMKWCVARFKTSGIVVNDRHLKPS